MELIYPTSRQFPVDEVCEEIVRALEEKNWDVPGIKIEFSQLSSDRKTYNYVSGITGDDFKLWFCRKQEKLSKYRPNLAAVSKILIPKKELHVFDDESGPTLYLYVGDDYKNDRQEFMNGAKVNSKLNGKPKKYLRYSGACNCKQTHCATFGADLLITAVSGDKDKLSQATHNHPGKRPPLLVHDNDLGREYDPRPEDPQFFYTEKVMKEFKAYLQKNVLTKVKKNQKTTI